MKYLVLFAIAYLLYRFYRIGKLAGARGTDLHKNEINPDSAKKKSDYIDYEELKD